MKLRVKKLHKDAVLPKYAHKGDSGFDLYAVEDIIIYPNETKKIPIGLAFDIPEGYEMQIRPRSGVTSKTKLRVQLGTVDSGYKGEVMVMVDNIANPFSYDDSSGLLLAIDGTVVDTNFHVNNAYLIQKGDRIAQGIIAPVIAAEIEETDDVGTSERGSSGFGSTGIK